MTILRDPVTDRTVYYKALGTKIRERREIFGLTQAELGGAVGLSRTSVTNIEQGRQRLLLDQFDAICRALGASTADLLTSTSSSIVQVLSTSEELDSLPSVKSFLLSVRQGTGSAT